MAPKAHVTCHFCGYRVPPNADAVNARGDVGRVHTACFEAWDAREEAMAAQQVVIPMSQRRTG